MRAAPRPVRPVRPWIAGAAWGAFLLLLFLAGSASAQVESHDPSSSETLEEPVPSILVHLTHGPEHPTRAALAFNVARSALEQGHDVTMFLAGDAVQLLRDGVLEQLSGLGTGTLRDLYDGFVEGGGRFYLSGGSSRARGLGADALVGKPVEMAGPGVLVRLSLEHDRMFTY